MNATAQLETVSANAEKFVDWAISSQALQECSEGSSTSAWSPDRAVKRHEHGACSELPEMLHFSEILNFGDIMADRKFYATKEQMIEMYRRTGSTLVMAKELGVSKKLVLKYMDEFGIERQRRMITPELGRDIRQAARDGKSAKEIAAKLGFSEVAVLKYARANGIRVVDRYHRGFIVTDSGYIQVPAKTHPRANGKGYVGEHVLVMEKKLGRLLAADEVAHHKDYDKMNNEPDNLQLMTVAEHKAHHLSQKDCGRWKRR